MRFMARHRVAIASGAVVLVAASSIVAYALAANGYPTHRADLNDGGVWTVNDARNEFGRVNKPIKQLDAYLVASNQDKGDLDILQDGWAVIARNRDEGTATPVDVHTAALVGAAKAAVAADTELTMHGGTLAALDPASGSLWATTYDPNSLVSDIGKIDRSAKPLAKLGKDAALAVGEDGTIVVASPAHGLTTIRRTATGFAKPTSAPLPAAGDSYQVTTVGTTPIALVSSTGSDKGTLELPGGKSYSVQDPADAVLQQPGPASDHVLLATESGLFAVGFADAKPNQIFGKGTGFPASPLSLDGCVFAAWAGPVAPTLRVCGDKVAESGSIGLAHPKQLVFRVNRGQVLLNDVYDGNTWNIDHGTPSQVANWEQVHPRHENDSSKTSNNDQQTEHQQVKPPKAVTDHLGARPGQVTSLYVLDNDSDPTGGVLAIDSFKAENAEIQQALSISPDGQTLQIDLPANASDDIAFEYKVSSTSGKSSFGQVVVHPRPFTEANNPPGSRVHSVRRTWSVPVNGTITVPVLSDWRDYKDGDEVELTKATVSKGVAVVTTDGDIVYRAQGQSGTQRVHYVVSDGHGGTTTGWFDVHVLSRLSASVAPTAEPDAARGIVGTPIVIHPLANDLPGADPANPSASLQLAGPVAQPKGYRVTTDLAAGTVTVVPNQTGSVVLNYQAAYGNAPFSKNVIRVFADPKSASASPVAGPDVITLHGQAAAIVDVLANDYDPKGYVLAVQHAQAALSSSSLSVGVIDGHWLRIQALSDLSPQTQIVNYTISDGTTGSVTGQVTVTQLPSVAVDKPITLADYATVRSGDAVAIPVLDNDTSPSGAPLALQKTVLGAPAPGRLTVSPNVGSAYISGRVVRYVAPATVTAQTQVTVDYTAETADGSQTQVGEAYVTITPPASKQNPDQAPNPPTIEARVVAGDTITIPIPSNGIDPDGDSVMTTGIASPPRLGRIMAQRPNSIDYQAYPFAGNGGTDSFQYVVTDTAGVSATGTIRIAVVPPGDPQNPVAVDDYLTAAPGTTVQVDALANDLVSSRISATVTGLKQDNAELSAGTRSVGQQISIPVPRNLPDGRTITVNYQDDDGGLLSPKASVVITVHKGTNIPPQAFDQFPKPATRATSVSVNPLTGSRPAYDPDSSDRLTVTSPHPGVRVGADGTVTVQLGQRPQAVPYVVTDAGNGKATAMIYVPATLAGAPYGNGQSIKMSAGQDAKTIAVGDYVADPAGNGLHLTLTEKITAGPERGLTVSTTSDDVHLILHRVGNYNGPGEVTFEVRDGTNRNTQLKALITVPVQVGPPTPVLRCPSDHLIPVAEGGNDLPLGIATLCHVWTSNTADLAALRYTLKWKPSPGNVDIVSNNSGNPMLRALGSANPGAKGVLDIGVFNSSAVHARLPVMVTTAPQLTLRNIPVAGIKAGQSVQIHLANFAETQLRDPHFAIVGTPRQTTHDAGTTVTGAGAVITIKVGAKSRGRDVFTFTLTDSPTVHRAEREATGQIVLNILGVPDPPNNLTAISALDGKVKLRWDAPAYGSPDSYRVYRSGASGYQTCDSGCVVDHLTNGQSYTFWVVAVNAAGASDPSKKVAATPDKLPGVVSGLTPSNPQNDSVTVSWDPVTLSGKDPVEKYVVTGPHGAQSVAAPATHVVVPTPSNTQRYRVSVIAVNRLGQSPQPATIQVRSAGKPTPPTNLSADYATEPGTSTARPVLITWDEGDLQGAGPAKYSVYRDGTPVDCGDNKATSCEDTPPTGKQYQYAVKEQNAAADTAPNGHVSDAATTEFITAGRPDQMPAPTFNPVQASDPDGQITINFTTVSSHGTETYVHCAYTTNGSQPGPHNGTLCASDRRGWGSYASAGTTDSKQLSVPAGATITAAVWETNGNNTHGQPEAGKVSPPNTSATPTNGPPQAPGGGSCNLNGSQLDVNWGAVPNVGARTTSYLVALDNSDWHSAENVGANTSKSYPAPQDAKSHTAYVWSYDGVDNAVGPTTINQPNCKDPDIPTRDYTVDDAYLGGTCLQTNMTGGSWYHSNNCAGTWVSNGTTVHIQCAASGPSYVVAYKSGGTKTWYWYGRTNSGQWVRAAAIWDPDGSNGNPTC